MNLRNPHPRQLWLAALTIIGGVHLLGMALIPLMDVDAAQYASISREMAETGNYLEVKHRGGNYLDKPPLLFWMASISFKLFGVSHFTYRLPAFLFTLLGVLATYRLGASLYQVRTGRIAALMLFTCFAWWQFTHDVRCDTILAGVVIFATWQGHAFLLHRKLPNALGLFVGIALALLAKGPIGVVVPGAALFCFMWAERRWSALLRWEWLAGALLLAAALTPMCIGLYRQYGAEGVRFFFWTQSFGRITGENVWKNDQGYFFFVHTFLWSFMPWTLPVLAGLALSSRRHAADMLVCGGFIWPFLALSLSQYKLPHYIFVLFPFAALATGALIEKLPARPRLLSFLRYAQVTLLAICWCAAGVLCLWSFPMFSPWLWLAAAAAITGTVWVWKRTSRADQIWAPAVVSVTGLALWLNVHLFPALLSYQAGSSAAQYMQSQGIAPEEVRLYYVSSHAMEFSTAHFFTWRKPEELPPGHGFLLTNAQGREEALNAGLGYRERARFETIKVSALKLKFLHPDSRTTALWYLLEKD